MPYDRRLAKKKKFQTVKTSPIKLNDESILGSGIEKEMYIQLCRSIDLRPPQVTKDLYCKYESRGKPYYTYGPRKVEIVSFSPYIAVLHDFITESEIKSFIDVASPKLKRSQMVGNSHGNSTMSDYRVSEQTWINEEMSPDGAAKVTDRIQNFIDLMALSTRDAELYQVANYGIAGQYDIHWDQVMMENNPASNMQKRELFNYMSGDRLATVISKLYSIEY